MDIAVAFARALKAAGASQLRIRCVTTPKIGDYRRVSAQRKGNAVDASIGPGTTTGMQGVFMAGTVGPDDFAFPVPYGTLAPIPAL